MVSPQEGVKAVRLELERLEGYLQGLPAEGWSRPSACAGWVIGDVVAHLAWNGSLYLDRVTRGLKGEDLAPRPLRPPSNPAAMKPLGDFVQEKAISYRKELGEALLPAFSRINHEFVSVLERVGPDEWTKPCPWVGDPVPVRRFLTLRMSELGIHSWDVRSPADPHARLYPESLPLLMEAAKSTVLRALQPSPPLLKAVRLRWATTGQGGETLDLVVDAQGTRVEPPGRPGDVTFRCSAETFVMVVYGRTTLDAAMKSGGVRVEGDRKLATELQGWLKGV